MNAAQMAQTAYSTSAAPIRTDRGVEYDVFSRVTFRLQSVNADANYSDFAQALHENRKLWTLLAVDVSDPENELPQQLRAQIFYLAEFSLLHTSKVLAGKADAQALVDINKAVMLGLRRQRDAK